MARLYGHIASDSGEVGKPSRETLTVWAQTEYGRVTIQMDWNGGLLVTRQRVEQHAAVGDAERLVEGNVNTGQMYFG